MALMMCNLYYSYNKHISDNKWFKWCLVKYLNPVDHHPERITKVNKDFAKAFDFKDIIF